MAIKSEVFEALKSQGITRIVSWGDSHQDYLHKVIKPHIGSELELVDLAEIGKGLRCDPSNLPKLDGQIKEGDLVLVSVGTNDSGYIGGSYGYKPSRAKNQTAIEALSGDKRILADLTSDEKGEYKEGSYMADFAAQIKKITDQGGVPIIVSGIEPKKGVAKYDDFWRAKQELLNQAQHDFAQRNGFKFIEVKDLDGVELEDALHITPKSSKIVFADAIEQFTGVDEVFENQQLPEDFYRTLPQLSQGQISSYLPALRGKITELTEIEYKGKDPESTQYDADTSAMVVKFHKATGINTGRGDDIFGSNAKKALKELESGELKIDPKQAEQGSGKQYFYLIRATGETVKNNWGKQVQKAEFAIVEFDGEKTREIVSVPVQSGGRRYGYLPGLKDGSTKGFEKGSAGQPNNLGQFEGLANAAYIIPEYSNSPVITSSSKLAQGYKASNGKGFFIRFMSPSYIDRGLKIGEAGKGAFAIHVDGPNAGGYEGDGTNGCLGVCKGNGKSAYENSAALVAAIQSIPEHLRPDTPYVLKEATRGTTFAGVVETAMSSGEVEIDTSKYAGRTEYAPGIPVGTSRHNATTLEKAIMATEGYSSKPKPIGDRDDYGNKIYTVGHGIALSGRQARKPEYKHVDRDEAYVLAQAALHRSVEKAEKYFGEGFTNAPLGVKYALLDFSYNVRDSSFEKAKIEADNGLNSIVKIVREGKYEGLGDKLAQYYKSSGADLDMSKGLMSRRIPEIYWANNDFEGANRHLTNYYGMKGEGVDYAALKEQSTPTGIDLNAGKMVARATADRTRTLPDNFPGQRIVFDPRGQAEAMLVLQKTREAADKGVKEDKVYGQLQRLMTIPKDNTFGPDTLFALERGERSMEQHGNVTPEAKAQSHYYSQLPREFKKNVDVEEFVSNLKSSAFPPVYRIKLREGEKAGPGGTPPTTITSPFAYKKGRPGSDNHVATDFRGDAPNKEEADRVSTPYDITEIKHVGSQYIVYETDQGVTIKDYHVKFDNADCALPKNKNGSVKIGKLDEPIKAGSVIARLGTEAEIGFPPHLDRKVNVTGTLAFINPTFVHPGSEYDYNELSTRDQNVAFIPNHMRPGFEPKPASDASPSAFNWITRNETKLAGLDFGDPKKIDAALYPPEVMLAQLEAQKAEREAQEEEIASVAKADAEQEKADKPEAKTRGMAKPAEETKVAANDTKPKAPAKDEPAKVEPKPDVMVTKTDTEKPKVQEDISAQVAANAKPVEQTDNQPKTVEPPKEKPYLVANRFTSKYFNKLFGTTEPTKEQVIEVLNQNADNDLRISRGGSRNSEMRPHIALAQVLMSDEGPMARESVFSAPDSHYSFNLGGRTNSAARELSTKFGVSNPSGNIGAAQWEQLASIVKNDGYNDLAQSDYQQMAVARIGEQQKAEFSQQLAKLGITGQVVEKVPVGDVTEVLDKATAAKFLNFSRFRAVQGGGATDMYPFLIDRLCELGCAQKDDPDAENYVNPHYTRRTKMRADLADAIERYQAQHEDLEVDGIVGKETWPRLEKDVAQARFDKMKEKMAETELEESTEIEDGSEVSPPDPSKASKAVPKNEAVLAT